MTGDESDQEVKVKPERFGHGSDDKISGRRDEDEDGCEDNGGSENQFFKAPSGVVSHGGKRGTAEAGTFGLQEDESGDNDAQDDLGDS